mmetsp:Transcript_24415/g.36623  ORF Transcript_24415/g.36623 Transcript_24415/m.36623 type:complete len:334 (+) Transcript_24415:53-1054(+)
MMKGMGGRSPLRMAMALIFLVTFVESLQNEVNDEVVLSAKEMMFAPNQTSPTKVLDHELVRGRNSSLPFQSLLEKDLVGEPHQKETRKSAPSFSDRLHEWIRDYFSVLGFICQMGMIGLIISIRNCYHIYYDEGKVMMTAKERKNISDNIAAIVRKQVRAAQSEERLKRVREEDREFDSHGRLLGGEEMRLIDPCVQMCSLMCGTIARITIGVGYLIMSYKASRAKCTPDITDLIFGTGLTMIFMTLISYVAIWAMFSNEEYNLWPSMILAADGFVTIVFAIANLVAVSGAVDGTMHCDDAHMTALRGLGAFTLGVGIANFITACLLPPQVKF